VIGEAANRPQIRGRTSRAAMEQMRGIRNKVIHDYFDVAWDVVWETVEIDLPPLLQQVKSLLTPPKD
jgi:uncharacterized protein with HEPN domain